MTFPVGPAGRAWQWPVRWCWVRVRRAWWKPWTWNRWRLVDLTYEPWEHPMCRCSIVPEEGVRRGLD